MPLMLLSWATTERKLLSALRRLLGVGKINVNNKMLDLLKAIKITNDDQPINVLEDYYRAVSNDFRDNPIFSKPDERADWKFLSYRKISELVEIYKAERVKSKQRAIPLLDN
jgi:hypothetical protein